MDDKQTNGLKSVFTPLGVWAFSIGTSIGWGSFIVTACGMSRFENDEGVTPVYVRADRLMYENKSILKEGR
ncbi:MAG: hypothetical protein K6E53_07020 [Lachnospiraceae bacterium]|nr:hypothetical protein [Lachnospiraceae bacterium]